MSSYLFLCANFVFEIQSIDHCAILFFNFPITTKNQIRVGEADHKNNPRGKQIMLLFKTQNKTWDQEFNSTKLLIRPSSWKTRYLKRSVQMLVYKCPLRLLDRNNE